MDPQHNMIHERCNIVWDLRKKVGQSSVFFLSWEKSGLVGKDARMRGLKGD